MKFKDSFFYVIIKAIITLTAIYGCWWTFINALLWILKTT